MAHRLRKSVFGKLAERLNKFPLGAPHSELLYKILELLFTPEEAELVSKLPLRSFTIKRAAKIWQTTENRTTQILDKLADKGLLLDIEIHGERLFTLPPPMAGFLEFSMMRINPNLDQKTLSELLYQYINVEDEFIRNLFEPFETQIGRVFVNETAIKRQPYLEVLDFERVSHLVREASVIAVGLCYCRHKMMHVGKACNNPLKNCVTLNVSAESLIKHGIAEKISVEKCLDIFEESREAGLVQFGENVREGVNFICNCCKCCCEGMIAARKFGWAHPVHTAPFFPEEVPNKCIKCGLCRKLCPVDAIEFIESSVTSNVSKKLQIDSNICLGCGVCVAKCPKQALILHNREKRELTPVNSTHRAVLQAIEKGTLQNFIFDNQALKSHRAMAAILGVILKLPPIKQVLASQQMKSRFLDWLLSKYKFYAPTPVK